MALDVLDASNSGGDLPHRAFHDPREPPLSRLKTPNRESRERAHQLVRSDVARAKLDEIRATFSEDHRPRLSDIKGRGLLGIRPVVWAGIMLAAFQQFVGINVIFYYGATLWQLAGFTESQSLAINIVSGAVSIAACFVTIAVIDKVGRKPLLLIGSAGMAVTLFAMVYAFSHGSLDPQGNLVLSKDLGTIAVVAANLYVIFFNFSWGPVDVGDAGRDVPEPDPRICACGFRLRAVVHELPHLVQLPGHGGKARPDHQLHLLRSVRGDQLFPRAEAGT